MLNGVLKKLTVWPVLAFGLLAAAPAASAGEGVCEGYTRKQIIHRFGGRAAITHTPVSSPADLLEQLEKHRAEIEAIMAERGVGHLTEALFSAAASGEGLSERDLAQGEVFEWMAFRKRGAATTYGPMCVDARKTRSAYVIEIPEEEPHMAHARCSLRATGGACVENEIRVDAGGSSDGVEVTMSGPGGSKTIISGGATTWQGLPSAPGTYEFTAKAEAQGTKTVTTHTFVIPKVCLNLAFTGSSSEEQKSDVDRCSETASVTVAECQPSCSIDVSPSQVRKKESVTVAVTGKWDPNGIRVEVTDPKGASYATLTEFPATVKLTKRGDYTFDGTATNAAGSASCQAQATVGRAETTGGKWTARFFGLRLDPDDGKIDRRIVRADGLSERSLFSLESGVGAGAGLEYHFNRRIGLEGSALYVPLGSKFFFDLGIDWAEDDDDVEMLAFLLGPNFHLTPDSRVDFYIGPFVGIADLSSATYRVLGETHRRNLDADTLFGVQLGLDVPFGDAGWAVHFGARYIDMTVETEIGGPEGPEIPADPLGAEIGFAYSF